jgi:hypothetical protein
MRSVKAIPIDATRTRRFGTWSFMMIIKNGGILGGMLAGGNVDPAAMLQKLREDAVSVTSKPPSNTGCFIL